jgi:predicted PurR-regulated permease PerM
MHEANYGDGGGPDDPPGERGATRSAAGRRRRARRLFAGVLTLLALWVVRDYLAALAWAVLIAVAAWPAYRRFEAAMPGRRTLAPALFTLFAGLVLLVPLALVAIEVGREAQTALRWLAEAQQRGVPAPDWLTGIPLLGRYAEAWWRDRLSGSAEAKAFLEGIDRGALAAWSQAISGEFLHRSLLLLVTFMALFLLLRDGGRVAGRTLILTDQVLGNPGDRLAGKLVDAVRGTVIGTVLVALGEGLLIGLGYMVAGVPHAVLFGALTASFAMLPLGAWVAFGAAALTLLAAGGSPFAAAAVLAWGAAVMLAGDNLVQPALIGSAARLPFLWALIGILGGLKSFGLVGLFLGPVIMAAILTIWREWLDRDLPP